MATAHLRPLVYKDTPSVELTGGGLAFGWRSGLWFLPEWEPLTSGLSPPRSQLLNILSSRRIFWSGRQQAAKPGRRTGGFTGTAPSLPLMVGHHRLLPFPPAQPPFKLLPRPPPPGMAGLKAL